MKWTILALLLTTSAYSADISFKLQTSSGVESEINLSCTSITLGDTKLSHLIFPPKRGSIFSDNRVPVRSIEMDKLGKITIETDGHTTYLNPEYGCSFNIGNN